MTLYQLLQRPKDAAAAIGAARLAPNGGPDTLAADPDDWGNVGGLFPPRNMFAPPTIPPHYAPQQAQGAHHQAMLQMLTVSRQSSQPHQRARAAAALARNAGSFNLGMQFDPNAASVHIPGVTSDAAPHSGGKPLQKLITALAAPTKAAWTILDLGGIGIKSLSPSVFTYSFLTMLYLNHNNLAHVPPEICRLRHLALLDLSGNKLTSLPSEVGLLASLQCLFAFDNSLTVLPWELGNLFQLEHLGIEGNPIVEPIMSMIQKEGTQAVITYMRDHAPVANPPAEREWIIVESDVPTGPTETCSVFTYNILAEKCTSPKTYGYTPSWALAWEYRRDAILQEILLYSADIVCLQEVEVGQYESFFKGQLRELGDYDSVYDPKSRVRTMNEQERRLVDGCAIFYRSSKYALVDKHLVEFSQLALQRPDFKKTEDVYNRLMNKDHIAVVALLKNKETNSHLMVATCHLEWDPAYNDVKLVQVAIMLEVLEKLNSKYVKELGLANSAANGAPEGKAGGGGKPPYKLPLFICGDFNSFVTSGVVELLATGRVPHNHEDFDKFAYGTYTTEGVSHSFPLKSIHTDARLGFTNFTPAFRETIDFIWYSHQHMSVIGTLGGVEKAYVDKCVGFPNAHFPSDHIPVLAEFRLNSTASAVPSSHPQRYVKK
ncbi:Glucose-repressible alcohol dehydrogenase transcriptional effector [Sorochytrium milnesiophthora]